MLNFGVALYFGAGAYFFLWALQDWHLGLSMAIVVAIGGTFVLALLTGALAVRLKGPAFFVMTLIFVTAAYALSQNWKSATGGDDGITLDAGLLTLFGQPLDALARYRLGLLIFFRLLSRHCPRREIPHGQALQGDQGQRIPHGIARLRCQGDQARGILVERRHLRAGGRLLCAGVPARAHWPSAWRHLGEHLQVRFFWRNGNARRSRAGVVLLVPFEDYISSLIGYPRLFSGLLLVVIILVNREGVIGLINAASRRTGRPVRGSDACACTRPGQHA